MAEVGGGLTFAAVRTNGNNATKRILVKPPAKNDFGFSPSQRYSITFFLPNH